MQGVVGLILLVIGGIFIYDVFAGKASTLLGLLNGGVDTLQPVGNQSGDTSNFNGSGGSSGSGQTIQPTPPTQGTGLIPV